ncbi:DUF2269 domain-containing protein [Arthrobacter sp. ISL-30]|uniref:DUF2269 domain-containing protein n=1 Tax=Arthrobacter sp. ISL-30 TaxID=2819109 RepID=UPI001BEBB3D8|nr:DUF2269 domain-containing protein [Arthrobacter sp. ISL-30]MBT2515484.1 DUF2269 domain-containing protein [Arthrobacter sp. ISL-30]
MRVAQGLRKALLVTHVTASVGWLGAVAAFLALAITSVASPDTELARACTLAMQVIGWAVLVPLSVASLLTGILQSLVTPWGLFRHYWVLAKLVINIIATSILLMYMQTVANLAATAGERHQAQTAHEALQSWSPVIHASGALVLLILAVLLSIYKPRGMTRFGQRKQQRALEPTKQADPLHIHPPQVRGPELWWFGSTAARSSGEPMRTSNGEGSAWT